jgi:hypothetical protein
MKTVKLCVLANMLCVLPVASHAQSTPDAAPRLSPQAAYEQAVRPFDIIRRAPQNWSEIELDAFKAATARANANCLANSPRDFTGEDLIAYAKLCAFGQAWAPVEAAAFRYIQAAQIAAAAGTPVPMRSLSLAFDYDVQASLRLDKALAAFRTCQTMLHTVPYDDLAADAVDATAPFLQFSNLDDALSLLHYREAIVLAMLREPPSPAVFPVRTLYAEALSLPAMQQYAGQEDAASASFAEVEQALPATLVPDDAIAIAESRRRYLLLGSPLPKIDTFAWLMDSSGRGIPPAINASVDSATVLLLFPDWCTQCVALHDMFALEWKSLREQNVRFFALLAQAEAPPKSAPREVAKASGSTRSVAPFPGEKPGTPHNELQLDVKPTAAALLAGTPTFVVPNKTLDAFAAADFPLIVVADRNGIIRAMQITNATALARGGQIDQMATHVDQLWPAAKP